MYKEYFRKTRFAVNPRYIFLTKPQSTNKRHPHLNAGVSQR